MKSLACFIGVAFVLFSTSAFSQDYRLFRIGLGTGLTTPKRIIPGFLLYIEPSWRVHNNIALGLRIETMGLPYGDIGVMGSYSVNGQYYFSKGAARLFGGIGFGIYTPNRGLLASCTCENQPMENVFGFYPRLGLDYKHMVIALDYNAVQKVKQRMFHEPPVMNQSPEYFNAETSYLSLKIGFFIGGGRK